VPFPGFPLDPAALTAELLTAAMHEIRPGVIVDHVRVVDTKRCGEGIASTADRITLAVEYGSGGSDLPEQLVLKTMLTSPRAPVTMYENEVRFYTEIRGTLVFEAPRLYGRHFDSQHGRFGLLLEDLSLRDARFPSAPDQLTIAEVESLLDQMAGLHAAFWRSARFETDLAWLPTPLRGGMADVFNLIGRDLIVDQVRRHPEKSAFVAPLDRSLDQLWELLLVAQRAMAAEPSTLLHGDPHLGNTYLLPAGRAGLLDWQLVGRGCWAHDVTYLLVTGLAPDVRDAEQARLLRRYLDRLGGLGVDPVPEFEHAWQVCRAAALWGLMIGWLITPPANYGWAITAANLERVATAVTEFSTVALLEELAARSATR